jgi:hypothetical protein
MTGKDFYAYVKSGAYAALNPTPHGSTPLTFPGYELHKDDAAGYWYDGTCSGANWPDPSNVDAFFTFSNKWFDANPPVYVPANETPPTPVTPPELLREVAIKNLYLPPPVLDWNPKRVGNQGTLVNLETWFWLDNYPARLQVRAEAGNNYAVVNAAFGGMEISAPGEVLLPCTGPGTPYAPGAHTTCSLAFSRASSALGSQTTPVSVQTTWTGTWAVNGLAPEPITPPLKRVSDTANIRVDEVQTLVTGAR